MGFFNTNQSSVKTDYSIELLHKLGCKACPLARITGNKNPHMEASGAESPKVYILGEYPGVDDDEEGAHFAGPSGKLLRAHIPGSWKKHLRWNNVVRTKPPKDREPTRVEVECCRRSIEDDIAKSKPIAIFGLGALPLHWVSGRTGIKIWRGRRFPVNVGGHECWYYPMNSPDEILKEKEEKGERYGRRFSLTEISTEPERAFVFDLKRAFEEVDQLPEAVVHTREVAEYGIEIITGKKPEDLERLAKLLEWAKKQKVKGFDWETNGIRPYHAHSRLLTAAVGTSELSFSWAIHHPGASWSKSQREKVLALTIDFIENDEGTKAVHALGFEMEWTAVQLGKRLLRASRWDDSITQAHLIDERLDNTKKKGGQQGPKSLSWLSLQYFGLDIKKLDNLNKANLAGEKVEDVLRYNAIDAKYHYLLFQAQDEVIRREDLLAQYRMMRRRVPTCVLTQVKGFPVDTRITDGFAKDWRAEIEQAAGEIQELPEAKEYRKRFKAAFNPASSDDVIKMLTEILKRKEGWHIDRKDGREKFGTTEAVLKKINHPLTPLILRFRKASKRESTYLYRNTEDKTILWKGDLLHALFNTVFVETWRLSSSDPNLQNVPKRVEENKIVRKQLRAPKGHSVVSFDYGQIQPRIIAMLAKDPAHIKSLWERHDVHGDWAEKLAHAYPERVGGKRFIKDKAVMKAFRNDVKSKWVLAGFFGAQLKSIETTLEVPEGTYEAERHEFEETFAGVFEWHKELHKFYRENGYVETLLGVRRRAPLSYNQVINSPVQMMEGEIFMDGANRLSERAYDEDDDNYQPNIFIHDDMTFILPDDKIDHYAEKIITTMLDIPFDFINVPITIEMSIGPDMYNMTEVLAASSDDWKVKKR